MRALRIACGAGFQGDRIAPAVDAAVYGDLDYIVFECLAEATLAMAQLRKISNPRLGFDPLLQTRMEAILPVCATKGVKVVTNMGAANPLEAGRRVLEVAKRQGLRLNVAAVIGDDVLKIVIREAADLKILESGESVRKIEPNLVSANAYLGAEPIVTALRHGADIVIAGRTCDPSLFLAPMMYEFGWRTTDWQLLGAGTVIGHLLECGVQVCGGYFADPGYKDVPNIANLGAPIAEVNQDGNAVITKVPNSGGLVSCHTCKEQLLYEIHNPKRYVTADVVADFAGVWFEEVGRDRVQVFGGAGRPRTNTLKVSLGSRDGYIGDAAISYAGPGAYTRAKLAGEIIRKRIKSSGMARNEMRIDYIGVNSVHGSATPKLIEPYEVRMRAAIRTKNKAHAEEFVREVEALAVNGPYAGGGFRQGSRVEEVIAISSTLLDRTQVQAAPRKITRMSELDEA